MKKILFNDRYLLTKAVLEGRKTQTRRIAPYSLIDCYDTWCDDISNIAKPIGSTIESIEEFLIKNSKYKVGEVVAIAQSYKDIHEEIEHETLEMLDLFYSAGWKNKMFTRADLMPHQIKITNVRIERLQDISDDDCMAEGIEHMPNGCGLKPYSFYDTSIKVKREKEGVNYGWYKDYDTPREAYADLIDRVGKKGTFDSNPYVFVYDFKLIK